MPNIEVNKNTWDGEYSWSNRGDEWSKVWGGPHMQWYGTILPRIISYGPFDSILEIAPGYGRWTNYLKDICERLTVVDLSEQCIGFCKQRFKGAQNISYFVNDGKSLDMVPDSSIDFAFSFDSLVHADALVIEAYLSQLTRILKKNGVAFIHHSNLGEYHSLHTKISKIPKIRRVLSLLGIIENKLHMRDFSVDAKKVEILAEKFGLCCISQEIVPWVGNKKWFIDCISSIVMPTSHLRRKNRVLRNAKFMREAENLLKISHLYNTERS